MLLALTSRSQILYEASLVHAITTICNSILKLIDSHHEIRREGSDRMTFNKCLWILLQSGVSGLDFFVRQDLRSSDAEVPAYNFVGFEPNLVVSSREVNEASNSTYIYI